MAASGLMAPRGGVHGVLGDGGAPAAPSTRGVGIPQLQTINMTANKVSSGDPIGRDIIPQYAVQGNFVDFCLAGDHTMVLCAASIGYILVLRQAAHPTGP